uniref:Uncharacterized protein n=1 Tax=Rhizophora mucronata TaxID=61149 RepID=A0A2P2NJN3_RHIMU
MPVKAEKKETLDPIQKSRFHSLARRIIK